MDKTERTRLEDNKKENWEGGMKNEEEKRKKRHEEKIARKRSFLGEELTQLREKL